MNNDNRYDVFVSYVKEELKEAKAIAQRLREYDLKVFVADETLTAKNRGDDEWKQALEEHLLCSRLFVLNCSRNIQASTWVMKEIEMFKSKVYEKNKLCKMFILESENFRDDQYPPDLKDFLRTPNHEDLTHDVNQALVNLYREEASTAQIKLNTCKTEYGSVIEAKDKLLKDRFDHYGQQRFWSPFSKNKEVHIFTCGRDLSHTDGAGRGSGGRTNIDKWDYRSVLEITHYFAEHYPATRVKIEDPEAKLRPEDLNGPGSGPIVADLMRKLEDKDCVIIGSPDVSDFAELVLAKIHGLHAFGSNRQKELGFAITKADLKMPGITYWEKKDDEPEGVNWIEKGKAFEPSEIGTKGTSYGILVLCNNPFIGQHQGQPEHRILILGGFTGVATYGIAKLLTSNAPQYRKRFFDVDQLPDLSQENIELLFEVIYQAGSKSDEKDTRNIDDAEPPQLVGNVKIPKLQEPQDGFG